MARRGRAAALLRGHRQGRRRHPPHPDGFRAADGAERTCPARQASAAEVSDLAEPDVASEDRDRRPRRTGRSEEHTSELQSLLRISYAVLCLKKNNKQNK